MISVRLQGKPFNITVTQVYAPNTNAEEAEVERSYDDLQYLLEHQKWCNFHHRGLECKSSKSRDTWNNMQVWPWNTKWSRAKANRVFPRHIGHSKHPLPTIQHTSLHMDITGWSTPKSDWWFSLTQRWRSSIQSAKTRPEGDSDADHELLTGKFRLKLKKLGKNTSLFKYDQN